MPIPPDTKKDKPNEEGKPEASSLTQEAAEQEKQEAEEEDQPAAQQQSEEAEEDAAQPQSRVVEDHSPSSVPLPSSPEEEDDPLEAASKLPWEEDARIGRMMKTFSTLAIEKVLGLLVAALPEELSVRSLA